MTVELLQTLSTVSLILAAILFLVGVALFFLLDIKRVIGDVSGYTARKAIENIRQQNEVSGDKAYKPSPVNRARGKVTDKISQSGQIQKNSEILGVAVGTSELDANQQENTSDAVHTPNDPTAFSEVPDVPYYGNETTVLNMASQNVFTVEYEIGFCGSAEIIE